MKGSRRTIAAILFGLVRGFSNARSSLFDDF